MEESTQDDEVTNVFVNDQEFTKADGVKSHMTGAEIAALVGISENDAVVGFEHNGEEIGLHEKLHIKDGERFIVIHKEHPLHIFVNRRKFEKGDGVKHKMTGAEIAALVGVPADNAVIRHERSGKEIAPQQTIIIKNGEHFLVTRKTVEGGYE